MKTKISVYITSYNQKDYLKKAIESVLNQTLRPDEILIIDDGSTDGSRELIKDYSRNHPKLIHYHFNEKNLGISKTRNKALSLLSGDYVTFVDGDDMFYKDKILLESKALAGNPETDIVFSDYDMINEEGVITKNWRLENFNNDLFERSYTFRWPERSPFRSPMIKLNKWREIGFYDESLEIFEDLDMMLRLSKKLSCTHVKESLTQYRRHQQGISNQKLDQIIRILEYIYSKNESLLKNIDKKDKQSLIKKKNKFINNLYLLRIYKEKSNVNYLKTIIDLLSLLSKEPVLIFRNVTFLIIKP